MKLWRRRERDARAKEGAAPAAETVTRLLGRCQICEREQKLTTTEPHLLVLHGYKRPGWGEVVGSCFGVGAQPYEVAFDRLVEYLPVLHNHGAMLQKLIGRLSQKIESLKGFDFPSDEYSERYKLEMDLEATNNQLWHLGKDIARVENRISNWKPSRIRSFEEIAADVRAKKESSAAERYAARSAKEEKIAATKAKQADLAARRHAIVESFRSQFIELAQRGDVVSAHKLYNEMMKKKYSFFNSYPRELGIDSVLEQLGLATPSAYGGYNYRRYV